MVPQHSLTPSEATFSSSSLGLPGASQCLLQAAWWSATVVMVKGVKCGEEQFLCSVVFLVVCDGAVDLLTSLKILVHWNAIGYIG